MNPSEFDQVLIQKHLDGITTEYEAQQLSERIIEDPNFRVLYFEATQLHGALADETLMLSSEIENEFAAFGDSIVAGDRKSNRSRMKGSSQIAAALIGGLMLGLLGMGMVKALNTPQSVERIVGVSHGNFEQLEIGMLPSDFPTEFGYWSGDPAEVLELEDGNRWLHFVETGNVKGNPRGRATACNVFQLVDLTTLQKQHGASNTDAQLTLQLSATIKREAAENDEDFPRAGVRLSIQLFDVAPESIGENWPEVLDEALAVGNKGLRIKPGRTRELTASCLLDPEATVALISLNVRPYAEGRGPFPLGGFFADNVQLTLIEQPKLPVRVETSLAGR